MNCTKIVGVSPRADPEDTGQPQGDCPYNNYTIHLGVLYNVGWVERKRNPSLWELKIKN